MHAPARYERDRLACSGAQAPEALFDAASPRAKLDVRRLEVARAKRHSLAARLDLLDAQAKP
jgi:hypothetical protein